jgi:hypothetical protein
MSTVYYFSALPTLALLKLFFCARKCLVVWKAMVTGSRHLSRISVWKTWQPYL